ncbi:MAG: hypothetical protein RL011_1375 [Pseudomonadota bacterium]|jgi:hypothetical protein
MGLRIIDRHPPHLAVEVSESDYLAELEEESSQWARLHGFTSKEAQKQLLEKVRMKKKRMPSAEEVEGCARRIREQLAANRELGAKAHSKVDIATLLELI